MRLNNFFGPPDSARTLPVAKTVSLLSENLHRALAGTSSRKTSPRPPRQRITRTDFERAFRPFFVQSHVTVAPSNRLRAMPVPQTVCDSIDDYMKGSITRTASELSQNLAEMKGFWRSASTRRRRDRYKALPRVKDLVTQMQGQSENPIDLTGCPDIDKSADPVMLLKEVPVKHLYYAEDVRPAYQGTFTRHPPDNEARQLARNPFKRKLPDTDYEYDSEAEWEEPDPEGDDVDSDGEEDVDDSDDAEMEGFLDDEGCEVRAADARFKRPAMSGDLEPISTGLCWQDEKGQCPKLPKTTGIPALDLDKLRMEIITGPLNFINC